MMKVFFVKDLSPGESSMDAVVEHDGPQRVAKHGFVMVILDDRHC